MAAKETAYLFQLSFLFTFSNVKSDTSTRSNAITVQDKKKLELMGNSYSPATFIAVPSDIKSYGVNSVPRKL